MLDDTALDESFKKVIFIDCLKKTPGKTEKIEILQVLKDLRIDDIRGAIRDVFFHDCNYLKHEEDFNKEMLGKYIEIFSNILIECCTDNRVDFLAGLVYIYFCKIKHEDKDHIIEEISNQEYGLPEDVRQRVKEMFIKSDKKNKFVKEKEKQIKDLENITSKTNKKKLSEEPYESTSTLQEFIKDALQNYYLQQNSTTIEEKDEKYQKDFEGESKSREVIHYLDKQKHLDLNKIAYVSIGGGDGSEIEYAMRTNDIHYGILIEFSDYGANEAREYKKSLKVKGKELVVLQGDVMQRLNDCSEKLLEWRDKDYITGVILSAQSILHELPSRSPEYDPHVLLSNILGNFKLRIFYCREPAIPEGWPSIVILKVEGILSDVLYSIAKQVKDVKNYKGELKKLADGFVKMSKDLAVETLFMVLYPNNINRYRYEMEEHHTAFTPSKFVSILKNYIKPIENIDVQYMASDTFKNLYKKYRIHAQTESSEELQIPKAFVTITAFQDKRK